MTEPREFPPLATGSSLRLERDVAGEILAMLQYDAREEAVLLLDPRNEIGLKLIRYIAAGEHRDEVRRLWRKLCAKHNNGAYACTHCPDAGECPYDEAVQNAEAWENLKP